MMPVLELKNLTKKYGDFTAVDDVNLSVEAGEFVTLLGPSGSGKTTILQMVAGFHMPTKGSIELRGEDISTVPANRRSMGFVFQDYALFPHMTVLQNIAYPLKIRRRPKAEIQKKVEETMALVQLEGFAGRKPHELSGGQQQRVALARALVFEPELILMDEPLGALDKNLRERVQLEIKRIQDITGVTIIFVTHDQEEALVMSDRIAVLNDSRLVQYGSPQDLYEAPNSHFVADFIGENNFIPATVQERSGNRVTLRVAQGLTLERSLPASGTMESDSMHVTARPEALEITRYEAGRIGLRGAVRDKVYLGNSVKYIVQIADADDLELSVSTHTRTQLAEGDDVVVSWRTMEELGLVTQ